MVLRALVGDVVRGLGPRVDQNGLNLYFAPQALELRVFSEPSPRIIQRDSVVDRLVALVRILVGGMVDASLIPLDLEILWNETGVKEPFHLSVGVKDQPYAGEILDRLFDR